MSSGPYGTYLHGLAATVGERAWIALRDLNREAWVADLLLAAHVVPFRDSVQYAAFRAARDAGLAAVDVDEATRLNINRLVRGTILKPVVRGGAVGEAQRSGYVGLRGERGRGKTDS